MRKTTSRRIFLLFEGLNVATRYCLSVGGVYTGQEMLTWGCRLSFGISWRRGSKFIRWSGCIRNDPAIILVITKLPSSHDLVDCRSLSGVLTPALLDEFPQLRGEPVILGVLRQLRPRPSQYLARRSRVTHFFEWEFAGHDLGDHHPKREDVGSLGRHGYTTTRRIDNLRSEPSRIPNDGRGRRKARVGVYGGQSVIRQQRVARPIDEDVGLWSVRSKVTASACDGASPL